MKCIAAISLGIILMSCGADADLPEYRFVAKLSPTGTDSEIPIVVYIGVKRGWTSISCSDYFKRRSILFEVESLFPGFALVADKLQKKGYYAEAIPGEDGIRVNLLNLIEGEDLINYNKCKDGVQPGPVSDFVFCEDKESRGNGPGK